MYVFEYNSKALLMPVYIAYVSNKNLHTVTHVRVITGVSNFLDAGRIVA